jgi:hypothetical protein
MTSKILITTGDTPSMSMLEMLSQGASSFRVKKLATDVTARQFAKEISMAAMSNPDIILLDKEPSKDAIGAIRKAMNQGCKVIQIQNKTY